MEFYHLMPTQDELIEAAMLRSYRDLGNIESGARALASATMENFRAIREELHGLGIPMEEARMVRAAFRRTLGVEEA